jgi:K+-transporting ATPase ATPase C chain
MLTELKRAVLFTVLMMLLIAGYHLALWGFGRVAFPAKAEGSLIRRSNGSILGSRLIAQNFVGNEYFHPRPSAVDYNAASAGASNYGPSNPDHLKAVQERLDAVTRLEGVAPSQVPSDMVTTSGSGLDPDIPPQAADLQATRVARARRVPVERVRQLIRSHAEPLAFGFYGKERINVLELNLALDQSLGIARQGAQ